MRWILALLTLAAARAFVAPRAKVCGGAICTTELASTVADTAKPVPKVPANAWKWPPAWPFPPDFLEVVVDEDKSKSFSFAPAQVAEFQKHLSFFLTPGMSVLEIGAQTDSLLTPMEGKVKVERLALTDKAFSKTASSSVFSLQSDGVSEVVMPFDKETFDTVLFSTAVESLVEPRDVFREIWRVLKPGGRCIVCFSGKPNIPDLKPIKMWTTMTEEQKIWIVGSYYQYSAAEGWENIEGFDLLGAAGTLVFENKADNEGCFAVQASKCNPPSLEMAESPSAYFAALMPPLKHLGTEDKKFNALRLAADYSRAASSTDKESVIQGVQRLSTIYAVLKDVKDAVIPAPIKALLANALLAKWENTPAQVDALRKGLGLDAADEYWIALSAQTVLIPPRRKILLLAEMIPLFGVDPRVQVVPDVIKSVLEVLRAKFPEGAEEKTLQAYTADLIVSDFLRGSSPPERLTRYLAQAPVDTIRQELLKLAD